MNLMNLTQFIAWALAKGSVAKYNDGNFLGECVSLINQYCWRVFNIPADVWGHAISWGAPGNANVQKYFTFANTLQAGDILVYPGTTTNPYGHIEIYIGNGQSIYQNRNYDGKVHTGPMLKNYYAILRSKTGGDMPLSDQQVDRALKMGLRREPTAPELREPKYRDAGLLIDTLWNNGGKQFYTGQNPVRQDMVNLLSDAGITPTQADFDALSLGTKDLLYYLQGRLKSVIGSGNKPAPVDKSVVVDYIEKNLN